MVIKKQDNIKIIEQKKEIKTNVPINKNIVINEIGKKEIKKEEKNNKKINKKQKVEKANELKLSLNKIEKESVGRILKNDLVEIFQEIIDNNADFKNDIFFKNLIDTESKVAIMDNAKISHMNKEFESTNNFMNYENMNDLMKKYTKRARAIVEED